MKPVDTQFSTLHRLAEMGRTHYTFEFPVTSAYISVEFTKNVLDITVLAFPHLQFSIWVMPRPGIQPQTLPSDEANSKQCLSPLSQVHDGLASKSQAIIGIFSTSSGSNTKSMIISDLLRTKWMIWVYFSSHG